MSKLPTVINHVSKAEEIFTLAVGAELMAFQGHFPGNPILPGVVQVDWAVTFATQAFGPLGTFQGVDHLKFQDLIKPGEVVDLHLSFEPQAGKLRFKYLTAEAKKSSGIILFAR